MQGDFWIDGWLVQPQTNTVVKEGKTHHLEPRVMQVLVQLAMHPDEVLSKDRLLATVWQSTFVGDDVLVRCISEIRSVFGDLPRSSRVIQTIPKLGYRLIVPITRGIEAATDSRQEPFANGNGKERIQNAQHLDTTLGALIPLGKGQNGTSTARDPEALQVLAGEDVGQISELPTLTAGIASRLPRHSREGAFWRRPWCLFIGGLVALFLISLGAYYISNSSRNSEFDTFWRSMLHENDHLVICVADHPDNERINIFDPDDPQRSVQVKTAPVSIAMEDVRIVLKVIDLAHAYDKPYVLKSEGVANLSDLQSGPSILIGAYDNFWTLRATRNLRFRFWVKPEPGQFGIVDASDPVHRHWFLDGRSFSTGHNYQGYAIVARCIDNQSGKAEVILAGVTSADTVAAGDFIFDPRGNGIAQLNHIMRETGNKKNIEIVLSSQIIDGVPSFSKIEASYTW